MQTSEDSLRRYYREIADHELLGRDGEIALAKQIEARETELWRVILSSAEVRPLVLQTLEDNGLTLPSFAVLRRSATIADRKPTKASEKALKQQVRMAASQLRASDRDRKFLDLVIQAIDRQKKRDEAFRKWRRNVRTASKAAAESRKQFVNSNLRFVVSMCRQFVGHGVAMEDLIQEGNLGLIKSVDRFDYRRGYRFSTYAGWWIRHAVRRAVADTSRTVRVPVHVQDEHQQIIRAQRELAAKLKRDPTDEEIAEQCESTAERVAATRSRARRSAISLDEPLGDDGAMRLDILLGPANDERSPLDEMLSVQETARVSELLENLSAIQADILRKRFGLEGQTPMTLSKIGEQYNLSRERIRQIQGMALQKLRNVINNEDRFLGQPQKVAR